MHDEKGIEMDEMAAAVRNPTLALTSPALFMCLVLCVAWAIVTGNRSIRVGVAILLGVTTLFRTFINGPMLRVFVNNREASGGASRDFIDGLSVMRAYWNATEMYGSGVVVLLVVMLLWEKSGRAPKSSG